MRDGGEVTHLEAPCVSAARPANAPPPSSLRPPNCPSSNPLASISPPGARHECVPRACFEIYLNLSIPLGGTAHNSSPAEGVEAAKYSNGPEMVNSPGSEPTAPGSRSMSRAVFAFVPSLLHISLPCTPSSALKSSTPLNAVNESGSESALPGLMSLTSVVPLLVPSLLHSSRPCLPSFAVK